jgi:acetyl coenzyme A synthetase (ADP forming)-like protein
MTVTYTPAVASPARTAGSLQSILAPRSIAVIGASRRPRTMGHQVLANLIQCGFTGPVYPVNPQATSIGSVRSYRSIGDVPDAVELAIVLVPQPQVADVVAECAAAGVRGLVVITAGFRELGAEGAASEAEVHALVRRHGMRMVGPNCMGVINTHPSVSMNATFAPRMPPFGHCAFVSQSGALGVSVIDYAREYGIGISQFVSVGNKADVSGNDLLEAWEHDDAVKVILMYVENFGNPTRFLEIASRITRSKPIIAIKGGRTRAGALAARSHTGAMAASDVAVDALLTQAGVLRASSMEELFDMAMAFGTSALPRSRRTAVVTNAGGPGILTADAMDACGLELTPPSPSSVERIQPLLPPGGPVGNPLDLIASANPEGYRVAIGTLLSDPNIDCVVPIFIPPLGVDQDAVAQAIVASAHEHPAKPVLAVMMGHDGLSAWRAEMHRAGIPTYIFPESAARAVAALNRYREIREAVRKPSPPLPVDRDAARSAIAEARLERRTRLSETQAIAVLDAYGIPTAPCALATSRESATAAAEELGYPVVMKVVSPDISHKTDVGGVVLDIGDATAAEAAYDTIIREVGHRAAGARVRGVLVAKQLRGGRETIIGMSRDPSFGPLVMFGLGGIFAEVLRDVVFRLAPLTAADARTMVSGIRGHAILSGVRGHPPVNRLALQEVIRRVAQLAVDFPEIAELDLNPVLAFEKRVVAADCRVVLAPDEGGS